MISRYASCIYQVGGDEPCGLGGYGWGDGIVRFTDCDRAGFA